MGLGKYTTPKTNIEPKNDGIMVSNRNLLFQGVYFQVQTVSFREGNLFIFMRGNPNLTFTLGPIYNPQISPTWVPRKPRQACLQ